LLRPELQQAQALQFRSQQKRMIGMAEMTYLMGVSAETMTKYITGDKLAKGYLPRLCPAVRPPIGRGAYQIPLDAFEKWKDEVVTYWGKI